MFEFGGQSRRIQVGQPNSSHFGEAVNAQASLAPLTVNNHMTISPLNAFLNALFIIHYS